MAILDLIVRNKQKVRFITLNTIGKTSIFTPDNITDVRHSFKSSVTSNPVEDGTEITDNIILENRKLSIRGLIVEKPLETQIDNISIASNLLASSKTNLELLREKTLTNLLQFSTNRLEDAFNVLEDLWEKRVPFIIQTGFKLYENMIITSIDIPESRHIELPFDISLEQINIVQTEFVLIPENKLDDKVKHSGSSEQDLGRKDKKPITAEVAKKGSSVFVKIGRFTKSFFTDFFQ